MFRNFTRGFLTLAIALTPVLLAGCGEKSKPDGPKAGGIVKYHAAPKESYKPKLGRHGGQMVVASFGAGLKSLNPITAGETSTTDYTRRIFEALLDQDVWTQEFKPALAESWEHSADHLTWTFKLRKDIKFNNGMPLTADDVVFTYEVIYDPSITSSSRDIITVNGKQWKVEKVDEHTVRFTLPEPFAIFQEVMSSQEIVCKAVCEPSYKAGTFNSFMGADAKPQDVVGTGAFMLDSYTPGQRLILKRNPLYWKKDTAGKSLPYLDRLVFIWVQNIDAMMLKFKAGETDVYGLRGSDYPILKPLEAQNKFKIYELGPNMGKDFVIFNQNNRIDPATNKPYVEPYKQKWFRNVKFRQAISYAIDRHGLINSIYNGLASPLNGPMPSSAGYFYNGNLKKYDYDLAKAKAMLTEIGMIDRNKDGVIEDADGNKVEFSLYTNAGNDQREKTCEIVRKDLEQLGMKVSLKYIEFNVLVQKMDETFDWEAMVMSLTGGVEPHWGANVWKSNGRMAMWNPKQPQPSTEWEKRIDEIYAQGIREFDRAKRKALYDEWQVIANEQLPFVYTVSQEVLTAIKDKFENVYPTPLAAAARVATTWNIEEIFIKEGYPLE